MINLKYPSDSHISLIYERGCIGQARFYNRLISPDYLFFILRLARQPQVCRWLTISNIMIDFCPIKRCKNSVMFCT